MAKNTLLTIDGIQHRVKEKFITIDKSYHRIKKAYITVDGIWRLCYSMLSINYYGSKLLTTAKYGMNATYTEDYVLFAGGYPMDCKIDVYDKNFTEYPQRSFIGNRIRDNMGTINFASYAMFAGGIYDDGERWRTTNEIEICDNDLTISKLPSELRDARENFGAAVVKRSNSKTTASLSSHTELCIFFSGSTDDDTFSTKLTSFVDMFKNVDGSIVRLWPDNSSVLRGCVTSTGVSVGNTAIFNGRNGWDVYLKYHLYDIDGTRTIKENTKKMDRISISVKIAGEKNEYGLFVNSSGDKMVILNEAGTEVFEKTFTTRNFFETAVASIGTYALMTGNDGTVWGFDEDFCQSQVDTLSEKRQSMVGIGLDNKALFAGGERMTRPYGRSKTIDIYEYNND